MYNYKLIINTVLKFYLVFGFLFMSVFRFLTPLTPNSPPTLYRKQRSSESKSLLFLIQTCQLLTSASILSFFFLIRKLPISHPRPMLASVLWISLSLAFLGILSYWLHFLSFAHSSSHCFRFFKV